MLFPILSIGFQGTERLDYSPKVRVSKEPRNSAWRLWIRETQESVLLSFSSNHMKYLDIANWSCTSNLGFLSKTHLRTWSIFFVFFPFLLIFFIQFILIIFIKILPNSPVSPTSLLTLLHVLSQTHKANNKTIPKQSMKQNMHTHTHKSYFVLANCSCMRLVLECG